jgi:hypothetical protein
LNQSHGDLGDSFITPSWEGDVHPPSLWEGMFI